MLIREYLRTERTDRFGKYALVKTTRPMIFNGDEDQVVDMIKYYDRDDAATALSRLLQTEKGSSSDTGNSFSEWSLWSCDDNWTRKTAVKRIVNPGHTRGYDNGCQTTASIKRLISAIGQSVGQQHGRQFLTVTKGPNPNCRNAERNTENADLTGWTTNKGLH